MKWVDRFLASVWQCGIHVGHDGFLLVGVEPSDVFVATVPGHLLAGVDAAVLLDLLDGEVERALSVEVGEELLVAHGIERVEMAIGIYAACLLDEAVGDHLVDTAVDAVVELLALAAQTYLDDAEGALLRGARTEGGVGPARHVAYLEGVDDALGVLEVYDAVVLGVEQAEFAHQGFEPLGLVALEQGAAGDVVDRRDIVNPLAHGIDVHHAAAREQQGVVGAEEFVGEAQHIDLVLCRAVVVGELVSTYEVVLHSLLLLLRGGCRSDGYLGIELTRVGRQDGRTQPLGQSETQGGLAYTGRTKEYDEGFHLS